MGPRVDAPEPLGTVARRADVLQLLAENALSKPELEDRLHISRSTIDRATRELENAGFVRRTDGGFTATTTGRLLVDEYEHLTGNLHRIKEATRLLEHVPVEVAPTAGVLAGAELRWPEPPEPARVLEPLVDRLRDSNSIRVLSRGVSDPQVIDSVERQVVDGGTSVEVVLSDPMLEHVRSTYADRFTAIRDRENLQLSVTDELPYSLVVTHDGHADPRVILVTYGADSELRGVLYNDAPTAVAWGEDTFRRYRRAATEL